MASLFEVGSATVPKITSNRENCPPFYATRLLSGGTMLNNRTSSLPRISIITPSFNQAEFIDEPISSVLDQNCRNLEYIIIDGGSTDGSVDIIRKYEASLAYWVSEKDRGQAH